MSLNLLPPATCTFGDFVLKGPVEVRVEVEYGGRGAHEPDQENISSLTYFSLCMCAPLNTNLNTRISLHLI